MWQGHLKLIHAFSGSLLRGSSLFLQLIQQVEGLAWSEFVGMQRSDFLQ